MDSDEDIEMMDSETTPTSAKGKGKAVDSGVTETDHLPW